MSTENKGTALVTGASSGIGEVYAERLADRGYDLILAARRVDRLEAVAQKIGARTGRKVEVLRADLTDRKDISAVERRLAEDCADHPAGQQRRRVARRQPARERQRDRSRS